MSKITIKSGKGELTLKKSKSLVGLKTVAEKETADQEYVDAEVLKNLGGFNVVTLKDEDQNIDDQLDQVRTRDEVEVGTHVYFPEGSNRPLIATGEIFIVFEEGVSEEEQLIVLDEFKLTIEERRNPEEIIAKVTSQSPNPIKVAHFLQQLSMVKLAEPDLDTPLDEYEFKAPVDDLLKHQWHLKNDGFVTDVNFRLKRGADSKVFDAWKRLGNTGSSNIVVAVIDNGFDLVTSGLEKGRLSKPFDIWNQSSRCIAR